MPSARHVLLLVGGFCLGGIGGLAGTGRLDRTPPQIHLPELPDHPLRGSVPLQISATDAQPGLVGLTLDGAALPEVWDTTALPDGEHVLEITAWDSALMTNRATAALTISIDNTPPGLEIAQRSLSGQQGGVTPLLIRADEPLAGLRIAALEQDRTPYLLEEGLYRALIGIPVEQAVGPAAVTITATDPAGNVRETTAELAVAETSFPPGGTIRLSKAQASARKDRAAIDAMNAARVEAYRHVEPAQLWEGPFVRPIDGRRSSPFGRYRTYSDGRRSFHLGMDIAGAVGTPVVAAGGGEVMVAGWQHLFGNVVILHHGQGMATSYNHLSALSVAVGDRVKAGQVVGERGSTGQSTGPHLHWGMEIDAVAVDPEPFIGTDPGAWEDAVFVPLADGTGSSGSLAPPEGPG